MSRTQFMYRGVTFLQVALLLVLGVLEYLAGYRAGVAQHLHYRKIHYLAHYFQGSFLLLQALGLALLVVFAVKLCAVSRSTLAGDNRSCRSPYCLVKFFSLLAGLILFYFLPASAGLYVYAHALMVLEVCLLLEVVALWAKRLAQKDQQDSYL